MKTSRTCKTRLLDAGRSGVRLRRRPSWRRRLEPLFARKGPSTSLSVGAQRAVRPRTGTVCDKRLRPSPASARQEVDHRNEGDDDHRRNGNDCNGGHCQGHARPFFRSRRSRNFSGERHRQAMAEERTGYASGPSAPPSLSHSSCRLPAWRAVSCSRSTSSSAPTSATCQWASSERSSFRRARCSSCFF